MNLSQSNSFLNSSFFVFTEQELNTLKASGFICEDDCDELDMINRKRFDKSMQTIEDHPTFTIMTTSACNARCSYCYEKGILFQHMSDEVAYQTISFLVKKSNGKPIHISWFGGEPLFNKNAINKICNGLVKAGIPFISSMISNGFFARNISAEEFKLWKLREVQITLDAIGEKYNKIKNYSTDEKNPFKIVQDGIKHLITNNVNVSIRLNFDSKTIDDTISLIDWIYKSYGPNDRIMVYVANVVADGVRLPNDEAENPYIKLFKKLSLYGYINDSKSFKIRPRLLPCSTENRQYFVISPKGDLYKCEHMVNNDEEAVGNINSSTMNQIILKKWEDSKIYYEPCKQCICLPICQSGCKAYRFERNDESFCTPIKSCITEIVELFYVNTFEKGVRFDDLVLFPLSKTKKKISDYKKYCRNYLDFNKAKQLFVKNKCVLKLDSQFSESLAADIFFFDINHTNGLDGIDPITNKSYEVKGTGIGNSRVRFSKTSKACYVVWVKFEKTRLVLTKIKNNVYDCTDPNGFVDLSSYLKNNGDCVLKRIIINLN